MPVPWRTLHRGVALFFVAIGLVLGSIFVGAAPAAAHANLLFTSPAADSTIASPPNELTLLFDEPVAISGTAVTVVGPDGDIRVGAPVLSEESRALEIPIHGGTVEGVYTVTWQIAAQDGDVMGGSYKYAVGPAVALNSSQSTSTQGFWQTAVLRGLVFAALAVCLGEQLGSRMFRRIPEPMALPRSWMLWSSLLGLGASIGLILVLYGNGSLIAGFSQVIPNIPAPTRPEALALVEIAAFALVAAAIGAQKPGLAWVPLVGVVIAEALRAHPGLASPLLGIPLTMLHLAAAALWTGLLAFALRTAIAWRRRPALVRAAMRSYARPAVWLFVVVVTTGLATGLLLIPIDEVLTTTYGQTLLVKIVLVLVATGLALIARRRLRDKTVRDRVRRPARLESVTLFGVLGLSALLTVLPMPGTADAPLPIAPPTTGPVLPAGTLAGTIGVNARASAGQLVIELSLPEISDPSGRTIPTDYTLSGALANPDGASRQLKFRGCGSGCFAAPVNWKNGTSRLTLSPDAENWAAEQVGLSVPWPPFSADALLAEAVTAMQAEPALTLHERVTSDTTQGLGSLVSFDTSGDTLVKNALYASGVAPIASRLPDEDGHRILALSYPAEKAVLQLTLDEEGKIIREVLAAPHHLVNRTLIYP